MKLCPVSVKGYITAAEKEYPILNPNEKTRWNLI